MQNVDVTAPSAGSILEILVSQGDRVDEGTELVLLESMKMEIPVESPSAGTVAAILVNAGDPVEEGAVVARLEG